MQELPAKPLRNPIEQVTALSVKQAHEALKKAIRQAYIDRGIPLNTKCTVEQVSDEYDYSVPITREVTVHQIFPVRRKFVLMREVLTLKLERTGAVLAQEITLIEE